jgi:hypothetical protein
MQNESHDMLQISHGSSQQPYHTRQQCQAGLAFFRQPTLACIQLTHGQKGRCRARGSSGVAC